MNTSLRILIVDDSENDAMLLVRKLRSGGYVPDYQRVCTETTLREALLNSNWDLISRP